MMVTYSIFIALIYFIQRASSILTNEQQGTVPQGANFGNGISSRIITGPGSNNGINGGTNSPLISQVPVPCGSTVEVLEGVTYVIASIGFPNPYVPFSSCQWNFYTRTNQPVTIDCSSTFELAPNTQCSNGAFLALDPGDQQYLWYCGSNGPRNVASKTNAMSIFFWGSWQNSGNYRGFYCTVRTTTFVPPSTGGSCRCGQRQPRSRIVGGEEASIHEFPWVVLLIPTCGGTLINENFVLTAAHCLKEPSLPINTLPTVYIGEHRRSTPNETPFTIEMRARAVIPHENYENNVGISIKDYDIGLVELERPVSLTATPNIAPACAPNPLDNYEDVPVVVAGWGYTSFPDGAPSDVLMQVELRTVSLSRCKNDYPLGIVTNKMICAFAEGKDACFSDSGSPLMAKQGDSWVVAGLVSFGPETCAHESKSGVYTRVGDFIPWIRSKIGNSRTCPP